MINNAQKKDQATQSLSISTIPVYDSQNPTIITEVSPKIIQEGELEVISTKPTSTHLHSPEIKTPPTTSETTRLWIEPGASDLRVVIWDGVLLGFLMKSQIDVYFKVRNRIGCGAYAYVNYAVCLKENRRFGLFQSSSVAIKKLKDLTYLEDCDTEKYCETVSMLSYLQIISHENITKYYGTYLESCEDSNCFQRHLIFEYVSGINLKQIILFLKEHTFYNFTLEHTNYLFKQVSAVIQCLDYYAISHKDLHSNNLIYSFETHQLKIMDFGYSTKLEAGSHELKIANLFDMQRCLYAFLSYCFLKNPMYSESEESMAKKQKPPAKIAGYHTNLKLSWENLEILDEKIKEMLVWSAQISNQLGLFYYYRYDLDELNSLNLDPSSFLEKFHKTMRSIKNSEPLPLTG